MIRICLPIPEKLYKTIKRLKIPEEIEQYFPGFMFCRFTEQHILCPEDKIKRKLYYSGKKKKQTVKNLYMANKRDLILYKTKYKK